MDEGVPNPIEQESREIVESLLTNTSRQYTEAAHAEMMRRFTESIDRFSKASEQGSRRIFWLTATIVTLTLVNVALAIILNLR
ncbi:hypothetical protein ACFLRC_00770 [Candidatus Altiarchaeota archaeon]